MVCAGSRAPSTVPTWTTMPRRRPRSLRLTRKDCSPSRRRPNCGATPPSTSGAFVRDRPGCFPEPNGTIESCRPPASAGNAPASRSRQPTAPPQPDRHMPKPHHKPGCPRTRVSAPPSNGAGAVAERARTSSTVGTQDPISTLPSLRSITLKSRSCLLALAASPGNAHHRHHLIAAAGPAKLLGSSAWQRDSCRST